MRISDWSSDVCSSDLGLFQRRARLLADSAVRGGMVRGGAGGAGRRVELLRACGRCGDLAVRPEIRCGSRDGGRRAGRGAGDALGRRDRETVARLVRARRGGMIMISATPLDTDSRVHLAETLAAAGLPIADL